MKILTICEYGCQQPLGYVEKIPNTNVDTLKRAIARGLVRGWFYTEGMAENAASDELAQKVKETMCGVIDERFAVAVVEVAEEGGENDE